MSTYEATTTTVHYDPTESMELHDVFKGVFPSTECKTPADLALAMYMPRTMARKDFGGPRQQVKISILKSEEMVEESEFKKIVSMFLEPPQDPISKLFKYEADLASGKLS